MEPARSSNSLLAISLMLVATSFIAASTLMAKIAGTGRLGDLVLGDPLHPLQVSQGRFLFAFLLIGTTALATRLRVRRPNLHLHVLRTFCGWGGISLMFAAVTFIPMADATAISFLNPIFAMMLAIPLLGERVGPWRWLAAAIALCGALVLLRPTPASFQPAALLALTAAVVMGLEITVIKLLANREPPFQILLVNNAIGLTIATLAVVWVWQAPTVAQWAALAGVGFAMALAQTCFVNAMARAESSFVVPFSYATLIFATLFDATVFGQRPDAISALGAAIIIGGAALLAWREGVNAQKS
ncbi:MAG: hypothetical protein CSA70_06790 [Rhodobacterales bacterium]|nr:MAG: hypothetical protein CSA70_06790 [Rhodobacterales bacterium]